MRAVSKKITEEELQELFPEGMWIQDFHEFCITFVSNCTNINIDIADNFNMQADWHVNYCGFS